MKATVKKQIDEMTEDELQELLQRDYLRRLTRYRMIDDLYKKKYGMDFESFERENVIEKKKYTFAVESDAQEWELAMDGIKTIEKFLDKNTPYKCNQWEVYYDNFKGNNKG